MLGDFKNNPISKIIQSIPWLQNFLIFSIPISFELTFHLSILLKLYLKNLIFSSDHNFFFFLMQVIHEQIVSTQDQDKSFHHYPNLIPRNKH